jgi:hypothetical protein
MDTEREELEQEIRLCLVCRKANVNNTSSTCRNLCSRHFDKSTEIIKKEQQK